MLHPASVAVNLLPRTWAFVRNAWPILLALVLGRGDETAGTADLFLLTFFLAMTVGRTVMHYLTLRYRIAAGRLEIKTGLFNRQARAISPKRVQNIELVQNIFHKASGLVEIRIETASGTEVEGTLSALTEGEAKRLMNALDKARGQVGRDETEEAAAPPLAQNSVRDLLRYGATSTRFGAAAIGLGILMEMLQIIDPSNVRDASGTFGLLGAVAVVLAIFSGAWLLGIGNAVVTHYGFKLSRGDGSLIAEEGLFTRRRVELPIHKVQMVAFHEPLLRRLVGIGSVVIETAAARGDRGGTERALTMVPVVARAEVDTVARNALPQLDRSLTDGALDPPHPKALQRGLLRAVIRGTLIAGAVSWWWGWAALPVWLMVPTEVGLAWLDWRHQGWRVTDEMIVSRRGYLARSTVVVDRSKLQSVELIQGPLLRNYGLGELVLRVAGSAVALPLLDHDHAFRLASELSARLGERRAEELPTDEVPLEGLAPVES